MRWAGAVVAACVAAACSGGTGGSSKSDEGEPIDAPRAAPADSWLVAVWRLPEPLSVLLEGSILGPLPPEHATALREELTSFLGEQLGLDPTGISTIGLVVSPGSDGTGGACFFAEGARGSLEGDNVAEHSGVPFVRVESLGLLVAVRDGVLLACGENEAGPAAAALTGAKPRLSRDSLLGQLLDTETRGARIAIVAAGTWLSRAEWLAGYQIDGVVVSEGSHVRIVLTGDGDGPARLWKSIKGVVDIFVMQTAVQKNRAKASGDPVLGAMWIVAHHHLAGLAAKLEPTIEGRRLVAEAPSTLNRHSSVLLLGVAASVAIPAFSKYIKQAKSDEARQSLLRLQRGVAEYYEQHGRLPATNAPLTPADPLACCEKCTPQPSLWDRAPWTQLQFSVTEPHYYAYQYSLAGPAGRGPFTARAMGDLDCDGVYSTFEMYGRVENGELVLDSELRLDNELE